MEYPKFLSLLAASIGFVGALFLSKSVVALAPEMMLQLTSPYSRCAYAPEQIASMASQKADAVIGIVFILLAFAIQIFSTVFASESKKVFSSNWMGFWVAVAAVSVLTIVFSIYNSSLRDRYQTAIAKIAIRDFFDNRFRKVVDPVNLTSLETMAHDLLKVQKPEYETQVQFVKRIASIVNWEMPEECDLSRAENKNRR